MAFTVLVSVSKPAFADSFTFLSPGTVVWDGVYVNPYQANDNTQPANNPLTIYCDDWNTDFSGTPTWTGDIYVLTANNLPNLKFGNITSAQTVTFNGTSLAVGSPINNPDVYDLYLEAAYLDSELQATLASKPVNTTLQEEYAAANWLLFVDSSNVQGLVNGINASGSTFASAVFTDLSNAHTAVANDFNAAGWEVIVPEPSSSMQEFLIDPVPEPSAIILLSTILGLLGLGQARRIPKR